MKITSLFLKNNRVQVFVDGEYVFSCTQNFVVQNRLYTDLEVTPESLADLMVRAQISIVEYKLAEYAARARYSRQELQRKVNRYSQKRFGFVLDQDAMNTSIEKLKSAYLFDEEAIIKSWVNNLLDRSKSKNFIQSKLIGKGFEKKAVEAALQAVKSEDFDENLKTLLEKKRVSIEGKVKDRFELKQKLIKFAQAKGFQYAAIKNVLNEILE
jgi:regulatory protein